MKIILQMCFLVLFAVVAEAQYRVERAVGKNCPRHFDFPKGLTCKKCLKFRRRGTKAVFKCPKGYSRYGNRILVCRQDDTWNGDPPVCVKSGCSPIDTTNDVNLVMSLHPKFNDAVITFQCEADYILFGANEIHCDGIQWSHAPPRCEAISDLMECDFERDLCGWTQNHTVFGNQNWTRQIGPTATGGTGPKRDHTYPNSDIGNYLYLESSTPVSEGDRAVLVSPPYTADLSPMCFEFWYHMLGPKEAGHVGSLEVYVKGESDDFNGLQPEFAIDGNQNDTWHRGEIYIDSMFESYQIIIKATKKKSYISDIAIDDVRLYNCTQTTTTTTTTTTTVQPKTTAIAATSSLTDITNGPVSSKTSASPLVSTTSDNTTQPPTTINFTQSVGKVSTNTVTKGSSVITTNGSVAVSPRTSKIASVTTTPVGTSSESVISTITSTTKNITETITVVSTLQNVTEKPAEFTTQQPRTTPTTVKTVPTKVMTVPRQSTSISTQAPTTKQAIRSKVTTVGTMMTKRPETKPSPKVTTAVPTTTTKKAVQTSTMTPFKTMKPTTTSKTFPPIVTTRLKPSPTTPTSTTTIALSSPTSTKASTTPRTSARSSTPSGPLISYAVTSSSTQSSTINTSESLKIVTTVPSTNSTNVAATANQTKSVTPTISLVTTAKGSKGDNASNSVTHHPDDETLKPLMIGLGVGIIVGLIIIGVIGWVCMRRRKFYTSRYEDELKPITNAASTQSLNNVDYYQDDFDIEHVQ